jgi:NIMA (never in mitosis gene a)-related kinase
MSLKDFIILSKLGILFHSYLLLGSGSFSEVFKVKRITDNKIYALKKVQLSSLGDRERKILSMK